MHSTSWQNTDFLHSSDFSGIVMIRQGVWPPHDPWHLGPKSTVQIEVPGEALLYLVECIVRDRMISRLEQATLDEMLGLSR